jgi:hypothetical protein
MSRTPSRRGLSGKSKDDLLNLAGVGSMWTTGGFAQKGTTISKEIEPARKKASIMKPPTKKDYSDSKKLKVRKKEAVQKSPALPLQVFKDTVDNFTCCTITNQGYSVNQWQLPRPSRQQSDLSKQRNLKEEIKVRDQNSK